MFWLVYLYFIVLFLSSMPLFGQVEKALEFFPMHVGNEWQYIVDYNDGSGVQQSYFITTKITGDTLFANGLRYKKFQNYDFTSLSDHKKMKVDYLHLDTLSGNIYEYFLEDTIKYPIGILRDSLLCNKNNLFGNINHKKFCSDIVEFNGNWFGEIISLRIEPSAITKKIYIIKSDQNSYYSLSQNIGITSTSTNSDSLNLYYSLFYAKIGDKIYGNKLKEITNPLEYYPMHIGDFWQYETTKTLNSKEEKWITYKSVVGDTVLSNKEKYFIVESSGNNGISRSNFIRIDSSELKVYYSYGVRDDEMYDLGLKTGQRNDCKIILNMDREYFGESFETRVSDGFCISSTATDGNFLSKGLGNTFNYYNDLSWIYIPYRTHLIYAKVNGKEYGTFFKYKTIPSDFYPLKVGNKWSYEINEYRSGSEPYQITYTKTKEVIGDTTVNNINYFKVKSYVEGIITESFERVDNNDGKLYLLDTDSVQENLIADFSTNVKVPFDTYDSEVSFVTTYSTNVFEEERVIKKFSYNSQSLTEKIYSSNVGLINVKSKLDNGSSEMKLVGFIVDNKSFGDTSLITSVKSATEVNNFHLSQNYPNPFNPETTINFTIPLNVETSYASSLRTELIVYNILGKKVATLVNETKPPGNYSVNFDASDLPSGVYIYRFSVGNNSLSKKMILIK